MSKEAGVIFDKWKIKYTANMKSASNPKEIRKQLVFDLFSAFKVANCHEDIALSYVSATRKHITPDSSFFENAYNKSNKKRSKKDFISYLKERIDSIPAEAYEHYYPFSINGVEIKAELPIEEIEPEEDDKWETKRFYELSAKMGVTPEEPWYYKYNDGTPKLTPDGKPRKTMGDHIKKKN